MSLYSPAIRQKAWEMYFDGNGTLPEIAGKLGVPYKTVHTWHTAEKWASRRKQLQARMYENWASRWQRYILCLSAETIMRHFRMTEELDAHIAAWLQKEDLTTPKLCALARALKASSDVVFKYMKLHENKASQHTQPLIEVGVRALPAQGNGGEESFSEPF